MSALFYVPTCFKISSVAKLMLISNGATLKLSYKAFLKDFKVKANFLTETKVSKQCFL